MSSLVSKDQVDKVSEMVEFAKKEGAEVLVGGKRSEQFDKGYFYQPTLLTNCTQKMEIIQEEVFGPVLPVMKFSTLEEAVALSNDCQYGLTSSIFSENFNNIMYATNNLEFGERHWFNLLFMEAMRQWQYQQPYLFKNIIIKKELF